MFEQLTESSEFALPDRRSLPFILAVTLHVIVVGILTLVTPLFPESLPHQLRSLQALSAPILPPPPSTPRGLKAELKKNSVIITSTKALTLPGRVPEDVRPIVDLQLFPKEDGERIDGGVIGGVEGGSKNGEMGGTLLAGNSPPLAPPTAPVSPSPSATHPILRITVGGEILKANLIHQVVPSYPVLAKMSHIQGTVILAAVIAPDGSVEDLRLISGHPMLVSSALEAVRQWKYRPPLLNGHPMQVDTTITVNFSLSK